MKTEILKDFLFEIYYMLRGKIKCNMLYYRRANLYSIVYENSSYEKRYEIFIDDVGMEACISITYINWDNERDPILQYYTWPSIVTISICDPDCAERVVQHMMRLVD